MANKPFGFDATDTVGGSSVAQYTLVKTAGALVVSAAATDDCIGVTQEGYASGDLANIRIFGVTRVRAHDGSIAKFQSLVPAAAGRVDGHDGTTANPIVGIALEASSAQDDEILAFIGTPAMLAGFAA